MLRQGIVLVWIVLTMLLPGSPALAGFLGVDVEETWDRGLRITRVAPGSPAERLGLRPGFHILNMRGRTLSTVEDMRTVISEIPAHRWVTLDYIDGSEGVLGWAILAEDDSAAAMAAVPLFAMGEAGFAVRDGADGTSGPIVGDVDPGSAAAAAGVLTGDRIVSLDGRTVSTSIEFVEFIYNAPGATLPMTVDRNGSILELPLTIESRAALALEPTRFPLAIAGTGSNPDSDTGPDCGAGTAQLCDPDPVPQPAPSGPSYCGSAPDGTPIYC